jgi:hypothetical protein
VAAKGRQARKSQLVFRRSAAIKALPIQERSMRSLLLSAVLMFGCAENTLICTQQTQESLLIVTQDANGDFVIPDLLTFQIDGGPEQVITECSRFDGEGNCTGFHAGEEEVGEFTVRAALGASEDTDTATVDFDVCHVNTQTVVLTLTPP